MSGRGTCPSNRWLVLQPELEQLEAESIDSRGAVA